MISFDKAREILEQSVIVRATERIELQASLSRILAEDVHSDIDMPPFDKSAMDGYACKQGDLANALEVIEIIRAGDTPNKTIGANQCAKIMTGAMLPPGADCVIMVEQTELIKENSIRFTGKTTGRNIALKGEDITLGQMVLSLGTTIKPQHIALLASVGCVKPLVYIQPRVAVLTTGDEIVEPHVKPGMGCIRNSNGIQLVSQLEQTGVIPNYMGIVSDSPEATDKAIKQALAENDVLIITGGVSMGDYDFVPGILKNNQVELLFEQVAVQPGRPTVFGRAGSKFIFGLPGNPVSSFIIFELLVKPFLYSLMGSRFAPVPVRARMGIDYQRRNTGRLAWIPVRYSSSGEVMPVEYHGSAHLHSLCFADGIISVPIGVEEIKKGDWVDVRQF